MTTPYGLRIVWEFLDNSLICLFGNSHTFHYAPSFMDGRGEEMNGSTMAATLGMAWAQHYV